jgi:drug/metabolite transporter (DMT)-like permease
LHFSDATISVAQYATKIVAMQVDLKAGQMDRALNVGLWLLLAVIWSSSYAIIKIGVETIDPAVLVFGRMGLGAIILVAVMLSRGVRFEMSWAAWRIYFITGVMGTALPFFLISYGELHVSSSLAAILMGVAPIASVVLAHFVLAGERLTKRSTFGVLLGFGGLILLFGIDALSAIGSHLVGQIALVGAALCYALNTVVIKRAPKRHPLEMAAGSMSVGAFFIGVATLVSLDVSNLATPSTESVIAVIFLGVVPTAFAMMIFFFLVNRIEAKQMSQINFAVPVGGAIIGVLWLGEQLTTNQLLALPVVVLAIYLVTSKTVVRAAAVMSVKR